MESENKTIYYNVPVNLFKRILTDSYTIEAAELYIITSNAVEKFNRSTGRNFIKEYDIACNRYHNNQIEGEDVIHLEKELTPFWGEAHDEYYKTGENIRCIWEADPELWKAEMKKRGIDCYKYRSVKEEIIPIKYDSKIMFGLLDVLDQYRKNPNPPLAGVRQRDLIIAKGYANQPLELACFLMHLAIKSIIGKDPCKKITNLYIFSRMDGHNKSVKSEEELSPALRRFYTEYYIRLLKLNCYYKWGLQYYSSHIRGCYYSYRMNMEQLITFVEKERQEKTVAGRTRAMAAERRAAIAQAKKNLAEKNLAEKKG